MIDLRKGYLAVDGGHNIYYETYGNPSGIPVLFVHGGPGLGSSDYDKRFFDPAKHYAILFDQRGCNRSQPKGSIQHNTTEHLISDMASLLDLLDVRRVILFGGSWGATLSLLFAIRFPERVKAMVLRGVFLGDQRSMDHFTNGNIGLVYPEAWSRFISLIPGNKRSNLLGFLNNMVHSEEKHLRLRYAYEYVLFGMSSTKKEYDLIAIEEAAKQSDYLSYTQVQLHYATNLFFIPDSFILQNLNVIAGIPTHIVHGRFDILCPVQYAIDLHHGIPGSTITIPDAGHAPTEPALERLMIDKLRSVTVINTN